MKAIAITEYNLDAVALTDVADPEPGPGEVLVNIRAAALNRLDLWTASGVLPVEHRFPHVLGADGAGEIESVGEGVKGLKPGTSVIINPAMSCGACEFCRAGEQSLCTRFTMLGEHIPGTLAERIAVPAGNVFPFPKHLSFAEAAALGTTFITAYRMLFTRGRMQPGEWVLITGIGGGLALSLFQLARPTAGRIFVTSSSRSKLDRALEMGADEGIDYTEEDVGKQVRNLTGKRGVDMVVDSAAGPAVDSLLRALRKGGRLVVAGATAGTHSEVGWQRVFWNQLEIIGSTMGSVTDVADMLRMVAGARLRPIIDRTFSLAEGADALRYMDSGERFGKIVVEM
ncbi:MAG TPA: alcohol dehydrogenase catalytic domain-containing protein [Actinomycetota bacterium]|nr:alcohol dehydrogenase catalytic domain-containing protein [Actinomycetota bacterium]